MRVSFTLLVALAPAVAAWHTQRIVPAPRSPRLAAAPRCDAASQGSESEAPVASTHRSAVDLVAQSGDRRVAVSGLSPQGQGQQQQQFVGVPPPSAQPPTLLQKARTPFMGLTLLATAAVAAWQSNRLYARRQIALLDEFAATMVFHLGDEREMASCLRSFRQQVGCVHSCDKPTTRLFPRRVSRVLLRVCCCASACALASASASAARTRVLHG
jgi:hypothetical protein